MTWWILLSLTALTIGSFLNVFIFRYPKMLQTNWERQCKDFLNIKNTEQSTYNLFYPRSHCRACQKKIFIWQNIPLISFMLLKGRCFFCHKKIALQYPIIELLTLLLTVIIFQYYGFTIKACMATLFTWNLIALTMIDLKHHLLPDTMTLSFLWLGLLLNNFHIFVDPNSAIIGAIFGYTSLWLVATAFKWLRKKDGMGHGDFKMLAMLGAWLGFPAVINVLAVAVFIALLVQLALILLKKINKDVPIPFGPFLAIAGWITIMYGPRIIYWLTQTN